MTLPTRAGIILRLRRGHARAMHRCLCAWAPKWTPSPAPAVVIAPHQDDETFGCGGLIALKRRAGVSCSVVFLTDGSKSHCRTDTPGGLRAIRHAEALAATDRLGVPAEDVYFLDYPDLGLSEIVRDRQPEAVRQIAAILALTAATEVFTPHRSDRHPDHHAAYVLAAAAAADAGAQVFQYAVWLNWTARLGAGLLVGHMRGARCLDISAVADRKSAAIAAYRSQLDVLPAGFDRLFRGRYEIYFRPRASLAPPPVARPHALTATR